LEKVKPSIRVKVEHPFRVIKCQFIYRKTSNRGLIKKNCAAADQDFCVEQLVDGEKTNYSAGRSMSAAAACENSQKMAKMGELKFVKSVNKNEIPFGELLSINSRFCGYYSGLA
jgi:hypothetical protein